ncbi:MAG TPA: ribosome small subunit-dependent GTPase A [Spirochaetota bacterium]|nr:ribosome small subunit-dependent GTPase A [Spirochaetota bacterium]HOD16686.1 ribosome small subunit-dependent GTPase A [Spirochaetota bacterium]HPG52520.1 ribosome small subunit-dependent GTPase A [Spirochaetota bacterium]HPN10735.1 ribosome small subunit-dependent GTPase A [Spirochaetota bacterium]
MKGIVVKSFGKYYTVEYESGRINCVLRGKLRKDKRLEKYSEAVVVGDEVEFEPDTDGDGGAISLVSDRRNVFTRKYKDSDRDDLIAANLDRIVVIQCFGKPRLNLRFVDRLMVRGCKEEIPVTLCVNKLDLAGEEDASMLDDYYRGYDADILLVSAKTGEGLAAFREMLAGKLSILIGSSGVGKTSILNGLYPGLALRTTDVSESTGKGRHTTTNVEMFSMADGARIIDTPGLREFGLMDIEPEELGIYFMEFGAYSRKCGFSPCTHEHEPDCEVKRRVEKGTLSGERYISYLNILSTLKDYYENRYR